MCNIKLDFLTLEIIPVQRTGEVQGIKEIVRNRQILHSLEHGGCPVFRQLAKFAVVRLFLFQQKKNVVLVEKYMIPGCNPRAERLFLPKAAKWTVQL